MGHPWQPIIADMKSQILVIQPVFSKPSHFSGLEIKPGETIKEYIEWVMLAAEVTYIENNLDKQQLITIAILNSLTTSQRQEAMRKYSSDYPTIDQLNSGTAYV